jgi:DNA gyrase subunit A
MSDSQPPNPTIPGRPPPGPCFAPGEKIAKINVADEIKNSFLDYSMSVIISRALPDARDGLKPSQRRILYAMNDLGVLPNRKHIKCAKIVGETMGNYHPHGDQAIYPTLVHMAQPWAMRERLVDGQGNFGSVEGRSPRVHAVHRGPPRPPRRRPHGGHGRTPWISSPTTTNPVNPSVFPAAFPNLLVNGGTGIAVGMATNIPPHNLGEIIDGICAQIDKPDITLAELMKPYQRPGFSHRLHASAGQGIRELFRHRPRQRSRCAAASASRNSRAAGARWSSPRFPTRQPRHPRRTHRRPGQRKDLTDITAVRDESDENTRVVIELKRDAVPKVVINNLFKHTQLETTFAVNMLAIDRAGPRLSTSRTLLNCYIEHRREVILRRTRYELRQAEERAEMLEGYLIALANLDEFIRIIRSAIREEARVKLLAFEWVRRLQVEQWGILIRSEDRLVNGRYA